MSDLSWGKRAIAGTRDACGAAAGRAAENSLQRVLLARALLHAVFASHTFDERLVNPASREPANLCVLLAHGFLHMLFASHTFSNGVAPRRSARGSSVPPSPFPARALLGAAVSAARPSWRRLALLRCVDSPRAFQHAVATSTQFLWQEAVSDKALHEQQQQLQQQRKQPALAMSAPGMAQDFVTEDHAATRYHLKKALAAARAVVASLDDRLRTNARFMAVADWRDHRYVDRLQELRAALEEQKAAYEEVRIRGTPRIHIHQSWPGPFCDHWSHDRRTRPLHRARAPSLGLGLVWGQTGLGQVHMYTRLRLAGG